MNLDFDQETETLTMASNNLPGVNLPVLTDKNWDRWNSQMKVLFGFQDVLDVIENGFQPLTQDMTEEQKTLHNDMKKKDCKAMFLIHQCVDDTHFEKNSKCIFSKGDVGHSAESS